MNRRSFIRFLVAAPVSRSLPWQGIAKAIGSVAPGIASVIDITLNELMSTTIKKYSKEIAENIFTGSRTPLLDHLIKQERQGRGPSTTRPG